VIYVEMAGEISSSRTAVAFDSKCLVTAVPSIS
jgi:hypothetical protein